MSPIFPRRLARDRSSNIETVLILERFPDLSQCYKSALEQADFGVEIALDENEAQNKFAKRKFNIVVVDYGKPNFSFEILTSLFTSKSDARIIILYESSDASSIKEAEQFGIDLFLKKPVSAPRLVAAVSAAKNLKPPCLIVSR